MKILKANEIPTIVNNGIKRAANKVAKTFLSEDTIRAKMAMQNHQVADKFVKLNFDTFPEGSAELKLYEARTMLRKIAKDNGTSFEFKRNYEDPPQILGIINKLTSKKGVYPNGTIISVNDDINQIYHHNRLVGSILSTDKDGIEHIYPKVMNSEDNFLRHLYRTIDEAIKGLK